MPTTVPCASGVADDCRQHIPLGAVPWRDPIDAAAVCGPCGTALEMAKRYTFKNGDPVEEQPDEEDDDDEVDIEDQEDDEE